MPSNLNALIRYKQIDKCLRNRFVKCTIKRMQEMCTRQLIQYRGIYKRVSERSIREDIKTMRGDSLGFNAPIVVKNGTYSYSDDNYSIFKTSIDDIELLKTVMYLLIDEKENITNPRLQSILVALSEKTGIELPEEPVKDKVKEKVSFTSSRNTSNLLMIQDSPKIYYDEHYFYNDLIDKSPILNDEKTELFSWREILNLF